jgi:hypothetical protein
VGDFFKMNIDGFFNPINAFDYSAGTLNVAGTVTSSIGSIPTAPTPGVPEPAAWALMILGFGAVGVAMRRSSARTSVSFA